MPNNRGVAACGGSSSSSLSPEKIRGRIDPETVIEFLQSLKIPEGPKAGEPLVLAEYQKRFIRGAMAEGVMVALLSIGRGNAKTALAAGIALGSLMGVWDDQPRRSCAPRPMNTRCGAMDTRPTARYGFPSGR